jgi:hypothetical protein
MCYRPGKIRNLLKWRRRSLMSKVLKSLRSLKRRSERWSKRRSQRRSKRRRRRWRRKFCQSLKKHRNISFSHLKERLGQMLTRMIKCSTWMPSLKRIQP